MRQVVAGRNKPLQVLDKRLKTVYNPYINYMEDDMGKVISMGKANIIEVVWKRSMGKIPDKGGLVVNGQGDYFKVMNIDGKKVKLLQVG
jgi:hypothetical protein